MRLQVAVIAVFFLLASVAYGALDLLGAGATFPYPLYAKLFDDYNKETGVRINYQAIGSGGGVRQLQNRTVDFGATDAFINDKDQHKFKRPIIHIPTCLGAVVMAYNVPGVSQITLSGAVVADIFLGRITWWNHPRIQRLNPGIALPKLRIAVIHRSDGSGTSHVFTDYLSKVSPDWKSSVGSGKSVNWPAGLGGKGNPGVSGLIKQIPGALGYVELVYTLQNKMTVAKLKNRSGRVIQPSVRSVSAAVPDTIPDDLRVTITDTPAVNGYPISSFTWIVVYQDLSQTSTTIDEARAVAALLRWTLRNGPAYAAKLGYAPIPNATTEQASRLIDSLSFKGRPL